MNAVVIFTVQRLSRRHFNDVASLLDPVGRSQGRSWHSRISLGGLCLTVSMLVPLVQRVLGKLLMGSRHETPLAVTKDITSRVH